MPKNTEDFQCQRAREPRCYGDYLGRRHFSPYGCQQTSLGKRLHPSTYATFASFYFTNTGDVRVCCHNWAKPIGNILHASFDEIWRGAQATVLREGLMNYEFPAGCERLRHWQTQRCICGNNTRTFVMVWGDGGSNATASTANGVLVWPDLQVECAFNVAGSFPQRSVPIKGGFRRYHVCTPMKYSNRCANTSHSSRTCASSAASLF